MTHQWWKNKISHMKCVPSGGEVVVPDDTKDGQSWMVQTELKKSLVLMNQVLLKCTTVSTAGRRPYVERFATPKCA